ncbi:MAG TPA: VOC family protein [Burkholderiales bacterium]|nr:VOC family protein [Burkholderiales bacterium]
MPIQAKALGHVVLRVRTLERSVPFYRDVLGFKEVARYRGIMVFFSFGQNHHDLALMQIGPGAGPPDPYSVGMYHFALKVGDSLEELRAWKARLEARNVHLVGMSDHRVSQSLYIRDPDGIEIELYVDANPEIWKSDPAAVATIEPLII